jgi:hypothetical protein
MERISKLFLYILIFSIATMHAYGQIGVSNTEQIEKIKKGTTYIVMNNPASPRVNEYIKVFKNALTISNIEFIQYSEIEKYLSPGNSFFTMNGYKVSVEHREVSTVTGRSRPGLNYSDAHFYLELWTPDSKFFTETKKQKAFGEKNKIQVARIELYTDYETLVNPDLLFNSEYDGSGHIRNWGPGMLKNYIQSLMTLLERGDKKSIFAKIHNEKELAKLKTSTLYIPDYVLVKFNMFTGDESKQHKEKDLFEDYQLRYYVLSTKKLNENILNDQKGFYYLAYVKSSTDKYVSIINSLTGEMIYSEYTPVKYNLKSGDLKDLYKVIMRN